MSHLGHVSLTGDCPPTPDIKTIVVPPPVAELSWWKEPRNIHGLVLYSAPSRTKTLIMDVSSTDWEAHLDHLKIHKILSSEDMGLHAKPSG